MSIGIILTSHNFFDVYIYDYFRDTFFIHLCLAELTPNDGDYNGWSVVFKISWPPDVSESLIFTFPNVFPCLRFPSRPPSIPFPAFQLYCFSVHLKTACSFLFISEWIEWKLILHQHFYSFISLVLFSRTGGSEPSFSALNYSTGCDPGQTGIKK